MTADPSRCYVIAEAGVNHGGSLDLAHQLIDAAVAAEADAVKFQSFKTERLVTRDAPKAEYQKAGSGAAESQFAMLKRLELSPEDHRELRDYCRGRGIEFLSTPFDEESADMLERLNLPRYKISSGEVTNLPFLRHIARKGKPIILSTGMSELAEVEAALAVIRATRGVQVTLLHCTTNYPTPPEEANLRAMDTLRAAFHLPVGFSDHTLGIDIALAAVARGACVLEKHLTLDRTLPGPDQAASIEPAELAALVAGIRRIELALGDGVKRATASEQETRRIARKSIVVARDVPAGHLLTDDDVAIMRPGTGLPPSELPRIIGRRTRAAIARGTLLSADSLE